MPESEVNKVVKNYHTDIPFANQGNFYIKGANNLDWGMKKHLANIFSPKSGRTVIFAFDHGCCMGSPAGLERLDLLIPRLIPNVDGLMGTRGTLRSCVPPECRKAVILRASCGASMLNEDLSHEILATDIEDAIRLNADCLMVQTFIGADGQLESIENLSKAVNFGMRYGIPVMGVIAASKGIERTARYIKLATRIVAELGANIVNTCYCEEFEEVCAACSVPVVTAGGKKLSEDEALTLAYNAVCGGSSGIIFGRNIFQSSFPVEMASALGKIVHEGFTDKEAWQFFQEIINR